MKSLQAYIRKGKFYEAVVEQGSDIIFITDFNGTIRYHNAAVRSLGYPRGSLVGKNIFDYVLPESRESFLKLFKQSQRKAYNQKIEFQLLCRDKSYRFFEFNSINLKHRHGLEALILDCRDITQRKEDAAELLRLQKSKEQFMANISHEIRTPINGIAGMASLLMEQPSEEDQKIYLSAIRHSAENLKVIINDLLDLSSIESGKLQLEAIPFNPAELIQSLAQTFLYQIKEKRLDFTVNVSPDVNRFVVGDPARLNQILTNLISNAVKFTHRGSISVSAEMIKLSGRKYQLKVSVKDTGVGIPPDKLDIIFESFSQADASVTRRYGGTGLGLAIVRQLVQLQNGTITVHSKEHVGSEFTVTIPYPLAKESIHRHIKPTLKNEQPPVGLRVLLVEDNEINRLYAEALLKSWQCKTEFAENGLIAIEKVKAKPFDVVLMDVQMPVMDGFECAQTIRNLPGTAGNTPIVALTANATRSGLDKCFAAGMNAFLPKPFTREDLYRVLFIELKLHHVQRETTAINQPPFDLSYLKKVSGDNAAFIKDIISAFVQSASGVIDAIHTSLANENRTEVGRLVHQIKPSLTLLGMEQLRTLAINLEENCQQADIPAGKFKQETLDFIQMLSKVVADLNNETNST